MEWSVRKTAKMKVLAMAGIVMFHLQNDVFKGVLQIRNNEGILGWIERIGQVLGDNWVNIWGILAYMGFSGVGVFLLLSGYGLTQKYKNKDGVSLKEMWKQAKKILVPYWIAMPLTHVINFCLQYGKYRLGWAENYTNFFDIYKWQQYIESFFVFSRWFSGRLLLNFCGTWWFVGIIVQFYLIFPILFKLLKKYGAEKFINGCVVVTVVWRLIMVAFFDVQPVGIEGAKILMLVNFPSRLAEFGIGMGLAFGGVKWIEEKKIFFGSIAVFGFVSNMYRWGYGLSDLIITLGITSVIAGVADKIRGKYEEMMVKVSKISYLVYLYHEPGMGIMVG